MNSNDLIKVASSACCVVLASLSVSVNAQEGREPSADPRDISGTWWLQTFTPKLLPMDGSEVPLNEKGKERYEQNIVAFENRTFENPFEEAGLIASWPDYVDALRTLDSVSHLKTNLVEMRSRRRDTSSKALVDNTLHKCLPPGVTRVMASPYPFHILQSSNQVNIQYEMNMTYRIARMNAGHTHTDWWDPSYNGEPVASWDGDALVIDTINYNDMTFLDRSGLPHGYDLHTVERLRKINGGRQLEAIISIDDPEYYTAAWTTRLVYEWRPDVHVKTDWLCNKPHRDISSDVEGLPQ